MGTSATVLLLLLQAASLPAPDGDLDAFLEKAARAQFPGGGERNVEDFTIRFDLATREKGTRNEVLATHAFRRPDRVRTTVDERTAGHEVTTGFDGERYWLLDDKGVTWLDGRHHRKDRDEIDFRMRLSRDLAEAFSVRRLVERLEERRRLPDETRGARTVAILEGTAREFEPVRFPESAGCRLRLLFDAETGDLLEALATPIPKATGDDPAPLPERFVFREPRESAGVRLPRRIEVFVGSESKPAYEITIRELRLNEGLAESRFRPDR